MNLINLFRWPLILLGGVIVWVITHVLRAFLGVPKNKAEKKSI